MKIDHHFTEAPFSLDDQERYNAFTRFIEALRNVKAFNALTEEQLAGAVEDWHDVLCDVPTDELAMLRQVGLRAGLESAADFAKLWQNVQRERQDIEIGRATAELVRQATQNPLPQMTFRERAEQNRAFAGPDAENVRSSPQRLAAYWQGQRWRAGLLALACHCDNPENGTPLTAVLDTWGANWVCSRHRCHFVVPLAQTMTTTTRGVEGAARGVASDRAVSPTFFTALEESEEDEAQAEAILRQHLRPPVPSSNNGDAGEAENRKREPGVGREEAARHAEALLADAWACGLNLESLAPPDFLKFRLFREWFYARPSHENGAATLDQATRIRLLPVWEEERRRREAQRRHEIERESAKREAPVEKQHRG